MAYGSRQMSNSLPDTVHGPTLIAEIPYTAFAASTLYRMNYTGVLQRNAKARTFSLVNTMNEALTIEQVRFYDSTTPSGAVPLSYGQTDDGPTSADAQSMGNGDRNSIWGSQVDLFQIWLEVGSTAPTTGDYYIYVTEVF